MIAAYTSDGGLSLSRRLAGGNRAAAQSDLSRICPQRSYGHSMNIVGERNDLLTQVQYDAPHKLAARCGSETVQTPQVVGVKRQTGFGLHAD